MAVTGIKCPNKKCPSNKPGGKTRIWRKGFHPTLQGERQRYVCFVCGKTFYAPGTKPQTPRHLRKRGR